METSEEVQFVVIAEPSTKFEPKSMASYVVNEPRILLIGGGRDSLGIVNRCLQMGLKIIVADIDPAAPARKRADWFLEVDCYDAELVLDAAIRGLATYGSIDAVLSAGTDTPHVMAAMADCMAIPGPSLETARLSKDKYEQAQKLLLAGCNVPNTHLLRTESFPTTLSQTMVMKPRDSRGARGVMRFVEGHVITSELYMYSAQFGSGEVILQDWIEGYQISSESLVQDGKILWTAYAERNYSKLDEYAPYVIEDGCDMPPYSWKNFYENDWQQKAAFELERAREAIGLESGVLKGDLVWDEKEGNIWIVEVATRLSGGRMCSDITPRVWGVDFVGMAIRLALGDRIYPGEINPYLRQHACQRFEMSSGVRSHPERGRSAIGYGEGHVDSERAAERNLNGQRN